LMRIRVTTRWIQTIMNAHKQSSYHDKVEMMRSEPNPYYLAEWLIIEHTDEDDAFWSAWSGERTPGRLRGSVVGIETLFRDQLIYDLLFGVPVTEALKLKLATAFADLSERYGAERWRSGLQRLQEGIQAAVLHYDHYLTTLREETQKLDEQFESAKQQLLEETEEYEEGEFDLEAELRKLQAAHERKIQSLPAKILQRLYPDDALLQFMATGSLEKPVERIQNTAKSLMNLEEPRLLPWETLPYEWLTSYVSPSDMTKGWLPVAERQRKSLRWVTSLPENSKSDWIHAVFRGKGWEDRLAEEEFAGRTLHDFVWFAVPHPEYRQRLRDMVLQHWGSFVNVFVQENAEHFEQQSWILLLDPESLQQRLLRPGVTGLTADELIRRLCIIYAEGIRRGLDPKLLVSLYTYLAKHDKESFYSFVHGAKTLAEALPMVELPPSALSALFRGNGVRQASARKHLLQLLYTYLDSWQEQGASSQEEPIQKFADIVTFDKREAVIGWLQRHERDWRQYVSKAAMRLFTRMLRFRWIGTTADEAEQHRMVEEWLQRHSDWVVFETDTPYIGVEGVSYKIVKPGAMDADTGELLHRITVRAEWTDRSEVNRLLDDLKLL